MAKEDKIHNYVFTFGKKYQSEYERIFAKKKKRKKSFLTRAEKRVLDKAINLLSEKESLIARNALQRMIDVLERV